MDNRPPDEPNGRPDLISRRRLLALSGAGLAATVSGCALWDHPAPLSAASPAASARPIANLPPPPVAPPPTAPALRPASREILCRAAWGAAAARPGGRSHTLNRMTVHHTEVFLGDNANAPARLRQHQHYHQDTQGWIDIAYHFSVDRRGNIYELRSTDLVGDTATNYDPTGHFLVVCEGDFDREEVSEDQLSGTALVFAWAAQQFGIPTSTLEGHRDVSSNTTCPGASLYQHVTSGDLQKRVESLLAAGPVDLPMFCGPEATDIVVEVEAGLR
jgi:hypothetical protein